MAISLFPSFLATLTASASVACSVGFLENLNLGSDRAVYYFRHYVLPFWRDLPEPFISIVNEFMVETEPLEKVDGQSSASRTMKIPRAIIITVAIVTGILAMP